MLDADVYSFSGFDGIVYYLRRGRFYLWRLLLIYALNGDQFHSPPPASQASLVLVRLTRG